VYNLFENHDIIEYIIHYIVTTLTDCRSNCGY